MNELTEIRTENITNNKTHQISHLSMEIDAQNIDTNINKCYYYNRGYCKKKKKCLFFHPTSDCKENCTVKNKCDKRHRKKCKYGDRCYHNIQNICEFKHEMSESNNREDKIRNKEISNLKENTENIYKEKIITLEKEVMLLKNELEKEKETESKQRKDMETIRKTLHDQSMTNLDTIKEMKIQHKKEIEKIKNKYVLEIEIFKNKRNKEENERAEHRKNEIKDLYIKMEKLKEKEIINCKNCINMHTESINSEEHIKINHEQTTYNCKGCTFKTNWIANLKEHKKKCNNTKFRKK